MELKLIQYFLSKVKSSGSSSVTHLSRRDAIHRRSSLAISNPLPSCRI